MTIITHLKRFISWGLKELRMFFSPIDIKFYNHWSTFLTENLPHNMWFYRFMKNRKIDTKVTFFSVFGYRWFMNFFWGKKVFFSGEYLGEGCFDKSWQQYKDYCLEEVDLSLGFDYIDHKKYMRFPLWIMYFVQPEMTFEQLEKRIALINHPDYRLNQNRTRFCCQISHHDKNGIRKTLIDLCNNVYKVTCAGNFMNTTNELQSQYNDDKQQYLRNFRFNICPENVSAKGYVTEKILDAIVAGCIPIYWGGDKKELIEPDIFNLDAFLYYEEGKEQELLTQVKELWEKDKLYKNFIKTPPFKKNAAEVIWKKMLQLENRLQKI